MKIDSDKLQKLCDNVDLLEYAEKSMDFQRRGSDEVTTNCPLHVDKTPSLMITPSKGLFYCHSCHVGGNILNWLMTFEHMKFNDAVDKVAKLSGADIEHLKTCEALSYYKKIKKSMAGIIKTAEDRQILPMSYYEQFSDEIPEEWVKEGISESVLKKHEIRIDHRSNRIVYPVYDNDLQLIGVKGRTRFDNYKDLNIKKYINYQNIQTTDFLTGMKQNKEEILKSRALILFEGLKSVMHVESWGYCNGLSTETSDINNAQVAILIQMGIKEVTIAFDKDVPLKKIRSCTKMLRKYTNVFAIVDKWDLLQDKDSPCDQGKNIWDTLYERRIKI